MKRSFLSVAYASALALPVLVGSAFLPPAVHAAAPADVVDGVAAIVNGDVITFSQVRELVGPRERGLRSSLQGEELVKRVREARLSALDDLIDRQLIIQEFKKKDFKIPDNIINDRVNTIVREEFGSDRSAFLRTLQAQGFTMSKFRDAERDKIIVQAMRFQNVKSDFIASPSRVDKLYTESIPQFTSPEQIHLWLIAINKGVPTAAGEADTQKSVADEVREKLLKGAKFDQLAQLYSDDTSRQVGGDWGWIDRKTLNEKLTNVAFKLEPNKISPVIDQGGAYYILRVSEKKSSVTKPMNEVRPDLVKKYNADERQRLQEQWLKGLRAKAFIKKF